MNSKLTFLWLVVSVVCCGMLTPWGRRTLHNLGLSRVCIAMVFFVLGAFPFLVYSMFSFLNLSSFYAGGATMLASPGYVEHAGLRAQQAYALLLGTDFAPPALIGEWHQNLAAGIVVILSSVFLCALSLHALIGGRVSHRTREVTLLMLLVFLFLQTPFSPTHYVPINLWIALPLFALVVGAFLEWIRSLRGKRACIGAAMIVVLILTNCVTVGQYYVSLADPAGPASRGLVTYCIAGYLDAHNITNPIAMDWGFANVIPVLTRNRVKPIDNIPWQGTSNKQWMARTIEYEADNRSRFLFWVAENWSTFASFDQFAKTGRDMGRTVLEEVVFVASDGTNMAALFRTGPPDMNSNGIRIDCRPAMLPSNGLHRSGASVLTTERNCPAMALNEMLARESEGLGPLTT